MGKKFIFTENAPKPIGPYSQAVTTGSALYVSGQIPVNPSSGELVRGDITAQTRQVMENIKEILNAAGIDFSSVVKCTIYLIDLKKFPVVNEVYGQYFIENPPARETVQVSGLPMGAEVEISCIATM